MWSSVNSPFFRLTEVPIRFPASQRMHVLPAPATRARSHLKKGGPALAVRTICKQRIAPEENYRDHLSYHWLATSSRRMCRAHGPLSEADLHDEQIRDCTNGTLVRGLPKADNTESRSLRDSTRSTAAVAHDKTGLRWYDRRCAVPAFGLSRFRGRQVVESP